MLKSQIIDATSFTQLKVEFSLPQILCTGIRVCNLGVYGGTGFPVDGMVGQLGCISKVTISDGGESLSHYKSKVQNFLEFKVLQDTNSKNRNRNKALFASNYGMVLQNGGNVTGANAIVGGCVGEQAVRPRVCIDKKNLKTSGNLEQNSDLALLDLSMILGFLNGTYKIGSSSQISGIVPLLLFDNPKLSIEFVSTPASVCANATMFAQPYLIVDEIVNPQLSQTFLNAKGTIVGEYSDFELESVFLSNNTQKEVFLNGFYGKTLGNLILMNDMGYDVPLSYAQTNEEVKMLVNNQNLIQLTSGVNSPGKKACFTRMNLGDLDIVSMADRVVAPYLTHADDANVSLTSLYEGPANGSSTESNWYTEGSQSYLALPINAKIDSLKLSYKRTNNDNLNLLAWGEVEKIITFNTGKALISYL